MAAARKPLAVTAADMKSPSHAAAANDDAPLYSSCHRCAGAPPQPVSVRTRHPLSPCRAAALSGRAHSCPVSGRQARRPTCGAPAARLSAAGGRACATPPGGAHRQRQGGALCGGGPLRLLLLLLLPPHERSR